MNEAARRERAGRGDGPAHQGTSLGRIILRSLHRTCPNCGRGHVFDSWFAMRRTCPDCRLRLERNEESDYWVGGYLINFMIAEMIVAVAITLGVIVLWPDVPWTAVLYGTAAAAIVGPLITYPFSKTLWLGIDLLFRPPEAADFDRPATNVPAE